MIQAGDDASPETINPIFQSLIQRTQYLFEKFDEIEDKSVLTAFLQAYDANEVDTYSVVYFDPTEVKLKLARLAITSNTNGFKWADSTYVFGIVKSKTPNGVDVWLNGLIEHDNILSHVLDSNPWNDNVVSGPLFLSQLEPGKLTFVPSGLAVYVGYAKSSSEILLNPANGSNGLFFESHAFPLIDRPTSTPILSNGVWTLSETNLNYVGWVAVPEEGDFFRPIPVLKDENNEDIGRPKFYYNIPSNNLIYDGNNNYLSSEEQLASVLLRNAWPFNPNTLVCLTVNGVVQTVKGLTSKKDGIYYVNSDGIWWYNNTDGKQPWASDLPSGLWQVSDWPTEKGSENLRPRMMLYFTRLNPLLKESFVTFLKSCESNTNNSSDVIKIVSAEDNETEKHTGDLVLKFNLPVQETSTVSGYAVSSVNYNQKQGLLICSKTSVVSKIVPGNGLEVDFNSETGEYILRNAYAPDYLVTGIEPENSRFQLTGINSYLSFDYERLPCGLFGRILLPTSLPSGKNVKFKMIVFGKASGAGTVNLAYQYNLMVLNNPMTITEPAVIPISCTFDSNYVANTIKLFEHNDFIVPSSVLKPGAIISFRIKRNPEEGYGIYTGAFCIAAIYWRFA